MTLDELQAKRARILRDMGAADLTYGDRSIRHRPQMDLEAALKRVDAEIAALQSPQPRNFVVKTNRGIQ